MSAAEVGPCDYGEGDLETMADEIGGSKIRQIFQSFEKRRKRSDVVSREKSMEGAPSVSSFHVRLRIVRKPFSSSLL